MDHKCNGWGRGKEKISFLSYTSCSLLLSCFGFALSWTGYLTGWRWANWQVYRMTAYTRYQRQTPGILLNSGWHLNRELSLTEVRLWYAISNNNNNSHSHVFIGTTHFLFWIIHFCELFSCFCLQCSCKLSFTPSFWSFLFLSSFAFSLHKTWSALQRYLLTVLHATHVITTCLSLLPNKETK